MIPQQLPDGLYEYALLWDSAPVQTYILIDHAWYRADAYRAVRTRTQRHLRSAARLHDGTLFESSEEPSLQLAVYRCAGDAIRLEPAGKTRFLRFLADHLLQPLDRWGLLRIL